jgi:PIN domain nuclease of toxin-antitoxin system
VRILADTHILMWWIISPRRLSRTAYDHLGDRANTVYFSAASIWEIAIKASLKREGFDVSPQRILHAALTGGLLEMPVSSSVAAGVADLPQIHGDPFDRMLLAQALAAECRLYTVDAKLLAYGAPAVAA